MFTRERQPLEEVDEQLAQCVLVCIDIKATTDAICTARKVWEGNNLRKTREEATLLLASVPFALTGDGSYQ